VGGHLQQEPCPCPRNGQALPTILVVPIDVNECWALDHHYVGPQRTPLGDLVHEAKTYRTKPGDLAAAERLAECLAWWADHLCTTVPVSRADEVDVVCSVPANPPKVPYNLPDVLAARVADRLGKPFDPGLLVKTRPTAEIKFEASKNQKMLELRGAIAVRGPVVDKHVLIVDDLVLSGATLEVIASALRAEGAARIIALTATKADRGLAGARPG
jgi:predicted amidophosphoribosyltransferase